MEVASVLIESYADTVKWNAVYGGTTNAEDNSYASATPSGKIELCISNRAVMGKLKPGQKFYVDFTLIEEPAKT
jgi:hypothetical protein